MIKKTISFTLILTSLLVMGVMVAGCTGVINSRNKSPSTPANQIPAGTPKITPNTTSITGNEQNIVSANNQFAYDLYFQLAKDPQNTGNNIFFSPYSISSALALTYEGARGSTADEIRKVFFFPSDIKTMEEGFSNLNGVINTGGTGYTLNTANGLWAEKTFRFLPDYITAAEKWYGANTTNLDFVNSPDVSRQIINSWVSDKTNNKIQDLLPPGSIDAATRLVITNAVYFKGTWVKEFDVNNTHEADFRISPEKTVKVEMMQRTDKDAIYPYAETDILQFLSIPYERSNGKGLSMIVLLPKGDNLTPAEEVLDSKNISTLEQSAVTKQVMVYFPKFNLETEYSLPKTLSAMGMPTAFSRTADFSGMDGKKDLYISDIIHKAYVNVDEQGTEAAAATGVVMEAMAMPQENPIPVFRADHPFIFLIQDNNSGAILFVGSVTNPGG